MSTFPGCKFDEILILEGIQGDDKSTLLSTMAIRQEWFTDDVPIDAGAQKFIEQLRGKWITELSELSGMGKRDIEHLKSTASRQRDRARMAYGHFVEEVPRSFIIGTTNSTKYLIDLTGNRRFWSVLIGRINIEEFKKVIDQLWAEAAQMESAGASIRLPKALWAVAAVVQEKRTVEDPWFEILSSLFGDRKGKVRSRDLWAVLDMEGKVDRQNQAFSKRLSETMQRLGFARANLSFGGIKDWGCARGSEAAKANGSSTTEPVLNSPRPMKDRYALSIPPVLIPEGEYRAKKLAQFNAVSPMSACVVLLFYSELGKRREKRGAVEEDEQGQLEGGVFFL